MTGDRIPVGIDFSTEALHCTYGDEKPYFCRLPIKGKCAEDRLLDAGQSLHSFFDNLNIIYDQASLGLMVIEKPWMGVNARALVSMSQVQGLCMFIAQDQGWLALQEDPSSIRKAVMGVGSSRKKGEIKLMTIDWVKSQHGLTLDSDQADSVVIWEYAKSIINRITVK